VNNLGETPYQISKLRGHYDQEVADSLREHGAGSKVRRDPLCGSDAMSDWYFDFIP
jgi:hypothetical protein